MMGKCQEDDGLQADKFMSGTLGNDSDGHTRLLAGHRFPSAPELAIMFNSICTRDKFDSVHMCT